MNLYLVHCGFYDPAVCDAVYESHVNFFVVAESFEEARKKAKLIKEFKEKRMHVDGLQEIQAVDGCRIYAEPQKEIEGQTILISNRHRDLAPPKTKTVNYGAPLEA